MKGFIVERLTQVIQALSLNRDMESLQRTVKTAARGLTNADGTTIVLREGEQSYFVDEDAIAPLWKGLRFPMDACISGWVMKHRKPVLIEDIYADPRVPADAYRPTFVKSLAMVPIRTIDPIGAIGIYWSRPHRPTEDELRILQALADSTAVQMESIAILNNLEEHVRLRTQELQEAYAEIRQLSLVDELTGLRNRRGFFLLAEQERKAAASLGRDVFVMFIDADGLKAVNDGFGHDTGDQMLRALAEVLQGSFRESDIVGRLSGDEFCIFGIHDGEEPTQLKQRLEDGIAQFNAGQSAAWRLAASAGLYSFSARQNCSLDEAIAIADRAMYADKFERRSRSEAAGPRKKGEAAA